MARSFAFAKAHVNRGLVLLTLGRFAEGWADYEWRWRTGSGMPARQAPAWDGTALNGRTILLWAEQGLGTTVQFARYVPLVAGRGGRVVLRCQAPLVELFRTLPDVHRVIGPDDAVPQHDVQAPLGGLPRIFATTADTVPATIPYVRPNPAALREWRQRLAPVEGTRVAIAWQGNPRYGLDRQRSIPLEAFRPLTSVAGVRLISLQYGQAAETAAAVKLPLIRLPRLDEGGGFRDAAAVIRRVDAVVTSDTSIAHLAGALGARVWIALPHVPDWRWMTSRPDSPWYPTARLVRQPRPGDWHPVFLEIARQLSTVSRE